MNVTYNLTFLAKLLLPLLAIVTLWLLFSEDTSTKTTEQNVISRTSDYAMSNFTMTVMDDQGKPSRIITGKEMAHYPEDDSTDITYPTAEILEEGKDSWLISSNKGYTQGKGEDILLSGNVIITQKNTKEIELRTEKLNLDTVHDTAYTDLAVTIKSPHGTTDSVGLHSSLQEKTINLHSRVKGYYDAPPTN